MSGLFVYTSELVTRQDGTELVVYWAKRRGGKDREIGVAFEGGGFNIARQSQAESLVLSASLGEKMIEKAIEEIE